MILFKQCSQIINMEDQLQDIDQRSNIQATIDICFNLKLLRNLRNRKVGPIAVRVKAGINNNISTPYQIISQKSYTLQSKIDMQSYLSAMYYLKNEQQILIDQIICFKLHVPIKKVQFQKLTYQFFLQSLDQNSMDLFETKILQTQYLTHNSLLFVDSFFSCLFPQYGVCLQGTIHTHLLTCKSVKFLSCLKIQLYQVIDNFVLCYNKLRQKTKLQIIQQQNYQQQLPHFIDMHKYPQYNQIRFYCQNKIFQDLNSKQHREVLSKFINYFVPEMSIKMQILWNSFIKNIYFHTQNHKKRYFQLLQIQIKNKVQFYSQKLKEQKLNCKKKTQESFSIMEQSKLYNKALNFEPISLLQTKVLTNTYKQYFYKYKNDQERSQTLNIYGVQVLCPSLKVALRKQLLNNQYRQIGQKENHLMVLVHGLGATSEGFNLIQMHLRLANHNLHILSSKINQNSSATSLSQMGKVLASQIQQFIFDNHFYNNFKISFIGHSLGGLIIRASLPYLQAYKFNMMSLITLATPHLGYFFHNSKLNKFGMWIIEKIWKDQIMRILLMKDFKEQNSTNQSLYRNSQLYQLSMKQGLQWFEYVLFYGCLEDYFVSPISALIQSNKQIYKGESMQQKIWQQMRLNIEKSLSQSNTYRLLIDFGPEVKIETTLKDQMLGKKAHVLYLSSISFITYLIQGNKHLFN